MRINGSPIRRHARLSAEGYGVRRYDLISTLFLMGLAVYVTLSGVRLGFGEWREPGPGFLAVLSGLTLGMLAGVWFIMTLAKRWGDGSGARRFIADAGGLRKVGLTAGALVAFAFLLEPLGFPLATLAFMVFLLRAIEPQRWGLTLTLSIVTMVLCVLVFQVWLQVQFPEGPVSVYAIRKWAF
jgi:putative tricarboxylic transport membrane protein